MARRKAQIDAVPLELTPMIDVVFLLLIFFITTLKFKVLEGKLPTFLPKDVGVNATPVDELLEKVEIQITSSPSVQQGPPEYGMVLAINSQRVPSLQSFTERLRAMKNAQPDLKATLYPDSRPGTGVDYEQVIKVVDAAVEAGLTDITFAGVSFDQ